jgi:hypothetical protein
MTNNDCESCNHKKLNNDPELHCYMFKEPVSFNCMQHTDFDAVRRAKSVTEHMDTILLEVGILHGD